MGGSRAARYRQAVSRWWRSLDLMDRRDIVGHDANALLDFFEYDEDTQEQIIEAYEAFRP
jgi:hypothetical protein